MALLNGLTLGVDQVIRDMGVVRVMGGKTIFGGQIITEWDILYHHYYIIITILSVDQQTPPEIRILTPNSK